MADDEDIIEEQLSVDELVEEATGTAPVFEASDFQTFHSIVARKHEDLATFMVENVNPFPRFLALLAGDVIQNLTSALDHLAYQLVCTATNDKPPNPFSIYFPIRDDAAKYEAEKAGKIRGARPTTIKAIDAFKPYKVGNDLLWTLFRLNSIDKHRSLIAVGARNEAINLGHILMRGMQERFGHTLPAGQTFPLLDVYIRPADDFRPLKIGDELLIDGPDAEVNEKMQFTFDIALREPEVPQPEALLDLLIKLAEEVERVIATLAPELA